MYSFNLVVSFALLSGGAQLNALLSGDPCVPAAPLTGGVLHCSPLLMAARPPVVWQLVLISTRVVERGGF